jgi:predicted RNA-binding Zn-ribbon protein involved in translation (DUF1610 family)
VSILYPSGLTATDWGHIEGYPEREVTTGVECQVWVESNEALCDFEGDVVATEYLISRTEVVTQWTCPTCGTEHSESRDPSEDGL